MAAPEQWIKSPILEHRFSRDRLGATLFSSPKVPLGSSEAVSGPASFVTDPQSLAASSYKAAHGSVSRTFVPAVNFPHTPTQNSQSRTLKGTPSAAPTPYMVVPPPLSRLSKTSDVALAFRPPTQRDSVHPLLQTDSAAFVVPNAQSEANNNADGRPAQPSNMPAHGAGGSGPGSGGGMRGDGVEDVSSAPLRGVSAPSDARPLTLLAAQAMSSAVYGTLRDSSGAIIPSGNAGADAGGGMAPLSMLSGLKEAATVGLTAPLDTMDVTGRRGASAVGSSGGLAGAGTVSHHRYLHSSAVPVVETVGPPYRIPQRVYGNAVDKKGHAAVTAAAAAVAPPPTLIRPGVGAKGAKFGLFSNANNPVVPPPSWLRCGDVADDGTELRAAEAAAVELGTPLCPTDVGLPTASLSTLQHILSVKHDRIRGTVERWVGTHVGVVPTKPHPDPDPPKEEEDGSEKDDASQYDSMGMPIPPPEKTAPEAEPEKAVAEDTMDEEEATPSPSRPGAVQVTHQEAAVDAELVAMILGEADADAAAVSGSCQLSGGGVWRWVASLALRSHQPDAVDSLSVNASSRGWSMGRQPDGSPCGGRSGGIGLGFVQTSVPYVTSAPSSSIVHRLQQTLLQGTNLSAVAVSGASPLPPLSSPSAAPSFSSDAAAAGTVAQAAASSSKTDTHSNNVASAAPDTRRRGAAARSDLVAGHMTAQLLKEVVATSGLEIECVRLDGSSHLSHSSLLVLATSCRNLRMISLASCPQVDDAVLFAIADSAPSLVYLNVCDCSSVTTVGVGHVMSKAAELLTLCASGLRAGDPPPYRSAIQADGTEEPPDPLAYHARNAICRKLMVCDVSGSEAVTDRFVLLLATLCPRLTMLSVAACPRLTSAGIGLIGAHFSTLTCADLSCNSQTTINAEAFAMLARAPRNLASLDLGGCTQVDDQTLMSIVATQRSLRSLSLAGTSISDLSLSALAACCRQLVRLNLSVCRALSLSALLDLLHDVPSLSTLLLSACASAEEVHMLQAARPECKLVAHAWSGSAPYREVAFKPLKARAPKPAAKGKGKGR